MGQHVGTSHPQTGFPHIHLPIYGLERLVLSINIFAAKLNNRFQATWKLPLIQLLFQFTRQPFSSGAQWFTTIHLVGDPWGTIASLLYTIERGQTRTEKLRLFCKPDLQVYPSKSEEILFPDVQLDPDYDWKAFTLLLISYDELGVDEGEDFLIKSL
jgi:hypothetical protein